MVPKSYNISELFTSVAQQVPERTALVCAGKRRTYRQLDQRSSQLANALCAQGITQKQHVAIYLRNCVEYVETMLACFKIGAVPINVNYRYGVGELSSLFQDADVVACVTQSSYTDNTRQLLTQDDNKLELAILVRAEDEPPPNSDSAFLDYDKLIAHQPPSISLHSRRGDDLFILYTGGTTGRPKGVVWEHEPLFFATLGGDGRGHPDGAISSPSQLAERVNLERATIMAPMAPLMHGAAWWPTTSALLAGNTVVLYGESSFKGEAALKLIQDENVNALALVGDAMAIPLLEAMRSSDTESLKALRMIGSGGAVFSQWVQQGFRDLLPGILVMNAFGSSETGSQGNDSGASSEGLGTLRITKSTNVLGDDLSPIAAGSGVIGHLARTGHIPREYYGDPQASARTFVSVAGQRWVLTGDAATVDSEGNIVVFGRGSNCINTGGEKVFPEEVEEHIKAHPDVEDVLVLGLPHERLGSQVAAVVAFYRGREVDPDILCDYVRRSLAGYKVPRLIHSTQTIRRSPAGKPDYGWAKQLLHENRD